MFRARVKFRTRREEPCEVERLSRESSIIYIRRYYAHKARATTRDSVLTSERYDRPNLSCERKRAREAEPSVTDLKPQRRTAKNQNLDMAANPISLLIIYTATPSQATSGQEIENHLCFPDSVRVSLVELCVVCLITVAPHKVWTKLYSQ